MKLGALILCLAGFVAAPLHAETAASDQSSFTMKRESYQKKIEKDLDRLSDKIENLRRRSEKAGADTRASTNRQLDALQKNLEATRKKAGALTDQTADGWENFRKGLDDTVADLKKAYHRTASKF